MAIGRKLRESKNLSQGDIEDRTGLIRCHTSRVENGHTVPAIETLEKYATALEVPFHNLFCEVRNRRRSRNRLLRINGNRCGERAARDGKEWPELLGFAKALGRMSEWLSAWPAETGRDPSAIAVAVAILLFLAFAAALSLRG
jgi:transcriptional regulator with XRE-family HTH domain